MAEFSDYFENVIINLMRNVDYPEVAAYVALFTAVTGLESNAPTAEVPTAGGTLYARQLAGLSAASGGASSNASDITFPTAGASWGTVTHVALVDHLSNTTWGTNVNVLMWSELDASKAVGIGDTFKITAGDLDVSVT